MNNNIDINGGVPGLNELHEKVKEYIPASLKVESLKDLKPGNPIPGWMNEISNKLPSPVIQQGPEFMNVLLKNTPFDGPIQELAEYITQLRKSGVKGLKIVSIKELPDGSREFSIDENTEFMKLVVKFIYVLLPFTKGKTMREILELFEKDKLNNTISQIFGTILVYLCIIFNNASTLWDKMPATTQEAFKHLTGNVSKLDVPTTEEGKAKLGGSLKLENMTDVSNINYIDLEAVKAKYQNLPKQYKKFGDKLDLDNLDEKKVLQMYNELPARHKVLGEDPVKTIQNQMGGEAVVTIIVIVVIVIVVIVIIIAVVVVIVCLCIVLIVLIVCIAVVIIAIVIVVGMAFTIIAVVALIVICIIAVTLIQTLPSIMALYRAPEDDVVDALAVQLKEGESMRKGQNSLVDRLIEKAPELLSYMQSAVVTASGSFSVLGSVGETGITASKDVGVSGVGAISDVGVSGVGAVTMIGGNNDPTTSEVPYTELSEKEIQDEKNKEQINKINNLFDTLLDTTSKTSEVSNQAATQTFEGIQTASTAIGNAEQTANDQIQSGGENKQEEKVIINGVDPNKAVAIDNKLGVNDVVEIDSICGITGVVKNYKPEEVTPEMIKMGFKVLAEDAGDIFNKNTAFSIFKIPLWGAHVILSNLNTIFGKFSKTGEMEIHDEETTKQMMENAQKKKFNETAIFTVNADTIVKSEEVKAQAGGAKKKKKTKKYKLTK